MTEATMGAAPAPVAEATVSADPEPDSTPESTTESATDTSDGTSTVDSPPTPDTSESIDPATEEERQERVAKLIELGFLGDDDGDLAVKLLGLSTDDLDHIIKLNTNRELLEGNKKLQEAVKSGDPQMVMEVLREIAMEEGATPEEADQRIKKMAADFAGLAAVMGDQFGKWFSENLAQSMNEFVPMLADILAKGGSVVGSRGGIDSSGNGAEKGNSTVGRTEFIRVLANNPGDFATKLYKAASSENWRLNGEWKMGPVGEKLLREAMTTSDRDKAMKNLQLLIVGGGDSAENRVDKTLCQYLFDESTNDSREKNWGLVTTNVGREIFSKPGESRTLGQTNGEIYKLFKDLKDHTQDTRNVFAVR